MVRNLFANPRAVASLLGVLAVAAASHVHAKTELLAFSSPRCGPCQQLKPTLERLKAEGFPIRVIDVTAQPALAQQFRVFRVPCLVLVADRQELQRSAGLLTAEQIRQKFAAAGVQPARAMDAPELPDVFAGQTVPGPSPTPSAPVQQVSAGQPAAAAAIDSDSFTKSLLESSVRITVSDATGKSYGTGTIIDTREGDALVVTCGHLFRGESEKGEITIERFTVTPAGLKLAERIPGRLESYDLDRDVGLVSFRPELEVRVAKVAPEFGQQVNDRVWNVGCDGGADPTVRASRVTAIDRYHGPPNIETSGAPVQGRSGGGLFNSKGELIGVCFAADTEADEGLYSGLASVHAELDQLGLQAIYQKSSNAVSLAAASNSPAEGSRRLSPLPAMANQEGVVRGQSPAPEAQTVFPTKPPASAELPHVEPIEQASLEEIATRATEADVVVVIHSREAGGSSEVIKLDNVSPQFVEALRKMTR